MSDDGNDDSLKLGKASQESRKDPLESRELRTTSPQALSSAEELKKRYDDVLRQILDSVRPGADSVRPRTVPNRQDLDLLWRVLEDTGLLREQAHALLATFGAPSRAASDLAGQPSSSSVSLGGSGNLIGSRGIEALPGNALDVQLLVAALLDELEPDDVVRFARGELAATVERLESDGASREAVADIITQVIRSFPDTDQTVQVAKQLLGYAVAEDGRTAGYYLTLAMIGDLVSRGRTSEDELASGLAYHLAVRGVWRLADERDPHALTDDERRLVATNTHNLVATIWRLRDTRAAGPAAGPDGTGDDPIRTATEVLQSLSAVVSVTLGGNADWAGRCLAALGAPEDLRTGDRALATIGVLGRLGDSGRVWTADQEHQAWLPAASAVAAPVVGDPEFTPSRLFNSGVALLRLPDHAGEQVARVRIVVNLLGLRWALARGEHRGLAALADDGPLSCAVNLAGAVVDISQRDRWAEPLSPLRQLISHLLGALEGLDTRDDRVRKDRARLARAARQLGGVDPVRPDSLDHLRTLLQAALDLVRAALGTTPSPHPASPGTSPPGSDQELILDTATVVGEAFGALGIDGPWPRITELVDARSDPATYFVEQYGELMGPGEDDDRPGMSLFQGTGLVTADEWEQQCARLLADRRTMADVLRAL